MNALSCQHLTVIINLNNQSCPGVFIVLCSFENNLFHYTHTCVNVNEMNKLKLKVRENEKHNTSKPSYAHSVGHMHFKPAYGTKMLWSGTYAIYAHNDTMVIILLITTSFQQSPFLSSPEIALESSLL